MKKIVSISTSLVLARPFISLAVIIILLAGSVHFASKLTINNNQIDLLPPDYPAVVQTKKVIEMIGGNGFYTIVLKYKDEKGMTEHLDKAFEAKRKGRMDEYEKEIKLSREAKAANSEYYTEKEKFLKLSADRLNTRLLKEPDVRYISYKYNVDFLKDRLPLYIKTADLKELKSLIIKRLDPFRITLDDPDIDPNADFKEILARYQRLAKRDMFDEYHISSDKGMLLMFVKPTGSFIDIGFIRQFEVKVKAAIKEFDFDKSGITVGYTGTYKLNLDDYDSLINALKPVSITALVGIALLLVVFFRNPIFIIILMFSLVSGILISIGITGAFLKSLNSVTSIEAAILMGLGIDYGIQFLYRFREEYTLRGDLLQSVEETIYHTGLASFISALTTTSAFFSLMFSDFRGFSEFGMIACYGIVVIAICMYFITAIQIAVLLKFFPNLKNTFLLTKEESSNISLVEKFYSHPKRLLTISILIILAISVFAPNVKFNYSGRDLLLEDQESLLLYDEIGNRFDISSDPQVIVVNTLEESEAIFDYFNPMPPAIAEGVDQIASGWNFIPPINQQKQNILILKSINAIAESVKESDLKGDERKHLPTVKKYLEVEETSYDQIPPYFQGAFREVPTSKEHGFLLFVYPKIALWHGKDLMKFHDLVSDFEYPLISRRTLNTILYSEEKFILPERADAHEKIEYNDEEKNFILEISNNASSSELEELGILPGTAKTIISHRPYSNIEDMRKMKGRANTVGSVILFAKLAQIVQGEARTSIIGTLIIVVLILLLFYRSLLSAILSLFPLLVGIVVMLGIMGMSGLKVDFMNILVFPIVIGYGIQNGIYIYYRFLEEKNIASTLSKVGPAIVASTLTTLVGWGVLLIAEHRGLQSIGKTATVGIGSSLVVALSLLPALLAIFFKEKRENSHNINLGLSVDTTTPEAEAVQEEKVAEFVEELISTNESIEIPPKKKSSPKKKTEAKKKPSVKKKSPKKSSE